MNFYFNFCSQLVENRLFTASYDGTVKVWDVSGIKPDTIFGKETTTDKDKDQMKEAEKYGGVEGSGQQSKWNPKWRREDNDRVICSVWNF